MRHLSLAILLILLFVSPKINAQDFDLLMVGPRFSTHTFENPYVGIENGIENISESSTSIYFPFAWYAKNESTFGYFETYSFDWLMNSFVLGNKGGTTGEAFLSHPSMDKVEGITYMEYPLIAYAGGGRIKSLGLPLYMGINFGIMNFGVNGHGGQAESTSDPASTQTGYVTFMGKDGASLYFGVNVGYDLTIGNYNLFTRFEYDWHYFMSGYTDSYFNGNRWGIISTIHRFDGSYIPLLNNVLFEVLIRSNTIAYPNEESGFENLKFSTTMIGFQMAYTFLRN